MEKLKIGFIGLGRRGAAFGMTDGSIGLLGNVLKNSNDVIVTVICDKRQECLELASKKIKAAGYPTPMETTDYKEVMSADIDAIIISTSWDMHVQVALEGMRTGIPVAMEVGGTHSVEDCWKLVDCYEETKTPIFFMENCCFNKDEALATALVRNGLMGEVVYCQGSYCHDVREQIVSKINYRFEEYKNYNCENYPTHELGPIAKIMNITSGNRFTKLVSMSSKSAGLREYIKSNPKYAKELGDVTFAQGDIVTTMIECENGETIFLKLDTTLPRLYERGLTVSGTKGFYCQTTQSVVLDGKYHPERNKYKEAFFNQDQYAEYLPQVWKEITEEQIKAGHGGMDYIMFKHFFRCLKEKKPMPIDVYDAAAWMSVTALSEQSIAQGSVPVECPDFTRGKYKTRKTVDVFDYPKISK